MMSFSIIIIALVIALALLAGMSFAMLARQRRTKEKMQQRRPPVIMADGLRDLIKAGDLREATRVYREFMGVDHFTAQDAVAELARDMRLGEDAAPDLQADESHDDETSQQHRHR